ncbi:hypothetical protein [Streptomyces sp. NBC_00370]|uniref:hypothetical protein n=1 Tax=Streptomyces sp. NBC_00370 TaxID=2975728 RepID=UPI002E26212C
MSENANTYEAARITVLYGAETIRQRPRMYVGSVGERGLHEAVFYVLGRAANEVLAGRASSVDVALMPDGGVRVADNVDTDGSTDLEALLTCMPVGAWHAGRNVAVVRTGRHRALHRQCPVEPPGGRGTTRRCPLDSGIRTRRCRRPAHRRTAGIR